MSISTISFNKAATTQIMRIQTELRDALLETSSNRHADVGLTLGRTTGIAVSYRSQETSLDRLLENNKLVTQRLTLMEDTLEAVGKTADSMFGQLVSGLSNPSFLTTAKQGAANALDQLAGAMNLSVGGQYLFAGTQTDVRPLNPYEGGPAAFVRDEFQAFLTGANRTADTVTADELKQYFSEDGFPGTAPDGSPKIFRFDEMFEDPNWGEQFSDASDQPIRSRISKTETIESSLSANADPIRKLMAGYALLDLASGTMDAKALGTLAEAAQTRIGAGGTGVTALRTDLGYRQARIEAADTATKQQKDIFKAHVAGLEEIDIVEASERVSALRTQLEASLRVTGMIRDINILDYL